MAWVLPFKPPGLFASGSADTRLQRKLNVYFQRRDLIIATHFHANFFTVNLYVLGNDSQNFFPQL